MSVPWLLLVGCSAAPGDPTPVGADTSTSEPSDTVVPSETGTSPPLDTGDTDDSGSTPAVVENRDRLFSGYFDHLQLDPLRVRSNGVRGADLADVCELWDALDPSTQSTFLTITARLEGSRLVADGSSMLDHVVTATRIAGGTGSSPTDPGDCGGDGNRLFLSMDPVLHQALVDAEQLGFGVIDDIPAGGGWHASDDLAGPHAPFDRSDATEDGAPRGQVHFFADPASTVANAPLGRTDVEAWVDPYTLEIDQDYDCVHNSNPACEYIFYGPLCLPETQELGVTIYTQNYGSFLPTWRPAGC